MANDSGKRQTRSDRQADPPSPPAKRQRTSAFDVGTFSLIASDGTAFPVNAVVLAGNCKVFFDMLETGEGEEKSCTLTESKEHVEEFLKVFSDEAWLPPTWRTWSTMAKMADKYDSPRHRMALRLKAWHVAESAPFVAYAAGCILRDTKLANQAAESSLREVLPATQPPLFSSLSRHQIDGLELYRLRHLNLLRQLFSKHDPRICDHHPDPPFDEYGDYDDPDQQGPPGYDEATTAWKVAAHEILRSGTYDSPADRMKVFIKYKNVPHCCEEETDTSIDKLGREYALEQTKIPFPTF